MFVCLPLSFGFVGSLSNNVYAQSATATLSGVVIDENGAVISGADIAVISIAQGFQRTADTNDEGSFVVSLLPPGNYTVKAEHEGFNPAEVRDVVLNVNDQRTLKITLKVGKLASQTVDVLDSLGLIDESSAVGTTVDRQFVSNMPLNGRSVQPLINLSPGVVLTKASSTEGGQFSVNGQRANANYFTVDGVSANIGVSVGSSPFQAATGSLPGLAVSGGTNNLVSIDALEEFKIQTSSYAAEFGRTPGAQVQLITRAGTNKFHGSVYEYFRNEAFDANDWFNNARKLAKPATRQSDFGFVLGGPVLLPRFGEGGRQPGFNGKNSTFFFLSYEGLRLRLPQSRSVDVPSLQAREAAPAGIKSLLNGYPLPNGPNRIGANGQPNGFAVFNASYSNPLNLDATSIRVDHTASNRLAFFGRYNYSPSSVIERGQSTSFSVNTLSSFSITTETLTGGATISFTPHVIGEVRLNYSKNTSRTFFDVDDFGGAVVPPDSLFFPQGASRDKDLSQVFFAGTLNTSLEVGTAAENVQRQFNAVSNFSMIANSHQFKFGIDYRRLNPIIQPQDYSLFVQFNGIGTPGAATQPVGSALTGRIQGGSIRSSTGPRFPLFTNLSIYGQDNWNVSRRLTLSYGLRWELNLPPTQSSGQSAVTVVGLNNPATASIAPPDTPLWNTTYSNFAPRLGITYQLSQTPGRETVIRGGGGIFYDLGYGSIANAFGDTFPFTALKNLPNVPYPLSAANSAPLTTPTISRIFVFEPDIKTPRTYQWNFAVEQSLGKNQTLSASYVAAVGRELLRLDTIWGTAFGGTLNPAVFPTNGQVVVARNTATSDYHALQAQFQRRLTNGLQALASYTWGHSIDIASNDSFNVNTPAARIDPRIDRGPSDFDVRHAFNTAITYDIPSFLKRQMGDAIFRNWSLDALFTARSATPVNVIYSITTPGIGGVATVRPDLVEGIPLYIDDPTAPGGRRFNNTRVTIPGNPNPQIGPFLRPFPARQGSLGRNVLRGFPVYQLDLGFRRQFNFTERVNLQFKTEFFNIFNHPNFGDPDGLLASSTFGFSTAMLGRSLGSGGVLGGFNPLYQVGGPRSIQFSVKLGF
ncbi:MAG TPA: carboxypeptidase regulatory-like domain-containing protein [Pyrinomonadaceae bacterium]|nr:carboxypeptidase regulatory-like domain-containing protein [Pyrinomonadaceae bacterium]